MYKIFSFLYPRPLKNLYTNLLLYSNIKVEPDNFLGFIFLLSLVIAVVLGNIFGSIYQFSPWIIGVIVFVLVYLSIYLMLIVYADSKARFVEEVLPDVLQLMASNLRAGFTTDRALLLAARPEFGPLQYEINIVGKKITAGGSIEDALLELTKRVRSDTLARAVNLIISGIKSGGKLAELLQETSNDLKSQRLVEKKVRTSVNMYVIFIFIAVVFGAPLLLSLSTFLVEILSTTLKNIQIPANVASTFTLPIAINSQGISISFVFNFVIILLVSNAIMGSMVVGLISKGSEKEGIKLLPVLIIGSLLMFFLVRFIIKYLLGGLFNLG